MCGSHYFFKVQNCGGHVTLSTRPVPHCQLFSCEPGNEGMVFSSLDQAAPLVQDKNFNFSLSNLDCECKPSGGEEAPLGWRVEN